MNIETVEELSEQLADWIGIFGGCKNTDENQDKCSYDKSKPFCCRQGFCGAIQERIKEAVENDKKLELLQLK